MPQGMRQVREKVKLVTSAMSSMRHGAIPARREMRERQKTKDWIQRLSGCINILERAAEVVLQEEKITWTMLGYCQLGVTC